MALHELSQKELEKRLKAALEKKGTLTKIPDGSSLYLVVRKDGGTSWQLNYTLKGKQKTYSIGTYPKVSLSMARTLAQAAREKILLGEDPVLARRIERSSPVVERFTVAQTIEDWLELNKPNWSATHYDDFLIAAKRDVLPYIGPRSITEVTPDDLRDVLERVEKRGANYKLTRVHSLLRRVFEYAHDKGRLAANPVERVKRRSFTAHKERHFPSLTDHREFAVLLRDLWEDEATLPVLALRLNAYVFVRPQNLRNGTWDQVDLKNRVWMIPDEDMKMDRAFLVPLSTQAVALFESLKCITGGNGALFPSPRGGVYGDTTLMKNLHRLGYKERHSTHGFRASAKTMLEEGGFASKYTEKQLAHEQKSKVERAYNRAEYWDVRVSMMQAWADYVDALRTEPEPAQPWAWFSNWRTMQSTTPPR